MVKLITIRKKYLLYGGILFAIIFISLLGINMFGSPEVSSIVEKIEPEMKILSMDFDPQIVIKDIAYGEEVFKGIQTIPKTNYTVSAIVQNMTEKTMNNVPIKLTVSLFHDKSQILTKEGIIPVLEPGATAKIAFENIKALGDAKGKSATIGQHELTLSIKANPEGGMSQNTEAKIIFNIDSSLK